MGGDWILDGSKLDGHVHLDGTVVLGTNGGCGTRECPIVDELTVWLKSGVTLRQAKRFIKQIGGRITSIDIRGWCCDRFLSRTGSGCVGKHKGFLVITLAPSSRYFDLYELLPKYELSRFVEKVS